MVRIGDPDETLTGEHVYRISYRVDSALAGHGNQRTFDRTVVGNDWAMPIEKVETRIMLPGVAVDPACVVEEVPCTLSGEGRMSVLTTGPLPPRTGVRFRAGYADPPVRVEAVESTKPTETEELDSLSPSGPEVVATGGFVLLAAGLAGAYFVIRRRRAAADR